MLKLKKAEMVGFKSFCDRTTLGFTGTGIAAIVGPNGCGKSNISDAINWVLGEQSARSLRGERMSDVIFNGTRDRKPTGMAEVVLTLVDPEYHQQELFADAGGKKSKENEVVIARRLFRSGESEYLLNGQPCRLRDIQEIFLGTGLGPNSYAIIEQGRIGQILSSKPYDRRALIEEAAGVTKYKTKRRLAEARLEAARQNLSRVNDILEEVTRQVNSLKRQAAKARRYGELREQLRGQLRVIYQSRHAELEQQAEQARLELGVISERLKAMADQVEALEQEQFDLSRTGYDKEDLLRQRRESITGLAMEIDRARNRIGYQEQQIAEIQGRLKESGIQAQQVAARIQSLENERAACSQTAAGAAAELEAARETATQLQTQLTVMETARAAQEAELESLRTCQINLLGEVSELKNQLAQVDEYLAGLARQRERTERERLAAAQEQEEFGRRRSELLDQMASRQIELESVAARRASLQERLARLGAEAGECQAELDRMRNRHAEVRARRESLEQILSHRAYTAEAVKQLFSANGKSGAFRPLGIVADFLEVDGALEPLVEEFLSEELEYVLVESWDAASDGLRLLRTDVEGRATFLVYPSHSTAIPRSNGGSSLPRGSSNGVKSRLLSHIRFTNGLGAHADKLLPRLGACYLAESNQAARQLAAEYPECYFLAPEGECFHGCTVTGGKRTNAGPLALKRELRELAPRAEQLAGEIQARTERLQGIEAETVLASQELEQLQARLLEQEKLAAGSDQELKQIVLQFERAGERLSVAVLDLERLDHERARAVEQSERLQGELAERGAKRVELESGIQRLALAASDVAFKLSETAKALGDARARNAALEERSKAAVTALERLEQMVESERASAAELERQSAHDTQEIERLRQDNLLLADRAAQAEAERAGAEQAVQSLQAELEAGRARMAAIEEEIRAARAELDQVREQKSALEVSLARLESDTRHLEETCRSEMGTGVAELPVDTSTLLTGEALQMAEEQARQLREKIEAMGPVNMMALEEYQEAAQRQEFLQTQQTDLTDSIRDTQQAILEIDKVSRQQFQQAFEVINANFQETFRTLFGGGFGAMRLNEEENEAEAGIDIVAQPPGKRLQNVLLLSGGEKALTALALLLAVFRYQPSPFCVLDEVDAPLDEANIQRFIEMVKQMSPQTQFIIITHSKKTMEAASVLYGVTMEEPGVSRLVSVRFADQPLTRVA